MSGGPACRYYFGGANRAKELVDAETADESDPDVVEVHRLFEELPGVPTVRRLVCVRLKCGRPALLVLSPVNINTTVQR
jgi:hypothetical protein